MPGTDSGIKLGRIDDYISFDSVVKRQELGGIGATCSIVTSPVQGGMARSLKCETSLKGSRFSTASYSLYDQAGKFYYATFAVYATSSQWPDPQSGHDFTIFLGEDGSGACWKLDVERVFTDHWGHKLVLYDSTGAAIATASTGDIFPKETWVDIEIFWQHSATGSFILIRNGSSVEILENNQDFDLGGTTITWDFGTHSENPFFGSADIIYSKMLVISGIAVGDRLSDDYNIYTYRPGNTGNTPDCDEIGATGSLDTLDVGTFDLSADFDAATVAQYNNGKGGAVRCDDSTASGDPGPLDSGDFDDDDFIVAGKWCYNFNTSSALLTGKVVYGNYSGVAHLVANEDTGLARNNRIFNKMIRWGKRPDYVPDISEPFVIGFWATGAASQNMQMKECFCSILVLDRNISDAGTKLQIQSSQLQSVQLNK